MKIKIIASLFVLICIQSVIYAELTEINDSNFDEMIKDGKDKPWLLIYYLETCPHCKVAKEAFEKLLKKKRST